jgi:hypothetical protein
MFVQAPWHPGTDLPSIPALDTRVPAHVRFAMLHV